MPDIFLSYNREDQAKARQFAEAFERESFSVWWDVTLNPGEEYDRVTEKALSDAKAVIVLWSPRSVDSRWVRAEATQAQRNGTFVPVMIEACKRPIMFELTQTAELGHWKGDVRDLAWAKLLLHVRRLTAKDSPETPARAAAPKPNAGTTRGFLRRPFVLGGIALAAAAVVAVGGVLAMGPSGVTPSGLRTQRTAFFGFTATSTDPIAIQMAAAATDETFKTLNALGLETASQAQTQGARIDEQFVRAKELGARYVLAGEVKATSDSYVISIRLDDVRDQRTLWQDNTVKGTAAAKISLPVAAAARATSVVRCFASTLAQITREDDKLLSLLSLACARGDGLSGDLKEITVVWRDLAASATESAYVQGYFARSLVLYKAQVAASAQPALLEEARAATQQALKLDPKNGYALGVLATLAIADGRPRIDAEKIWADGLKDNPSDGNLNISYSTFLAGTGRYRDALPYVLTAVQSDPLRPSFNPESALANVGQPARARRSYEERNARFADPGLWNNWIWSAIFESIGDVPDVFNAAPVNVSDDTKSCWQDIALAAASKTRASRLAGADRMKACVGSGNIQRTIVGLGALGDLDGAFALTQDPAFGRGGPFGYLSGALFTSSARPMRADPRFLPLVKKTGIWDYWIDAKTHPDVCEQSEEKGFEVCVALLAAQGAK